MLTEVVRYLQSLERSDAQRRVENVSVMALLAQARLYDKAYSDEERRRCCIEACDALDKHASMLRQLVGVAMPVRSALVDCQMWGQWRCGTGWSSLSGWFKDRWRWAIRWIEADEDQCDRHHLQPGLTVGLQLLRLIRSLATSKGDA